MHAKGRSSLGMFHRNWQFDFREITVTVLCSGSLVWPEACVARIRSRKDTKVSTHRESSSCWKVRLMGLYPRTAYALLQATTQEAYSDYRPAFATKAPIARH